MQIVRTVISETNIPIRNAVCETLRGLAIVIDITQLIGYSTSVDKKLIAKVMAELGRRTSPAKKKAARENGKLGGRPRKKGKR